MDRTKHIITVYTSCQHKGASCRRRLELIATLRAVLDAAGELLASDFEISGVACMAGCDRPYAVAYHATAKAIYLFCDITPEIDFPDLVDFADQCRALDDGSYPSTTRLGKFRTSTLARVPSTPIISRAVALQ
jgi:predicted metal-binding protein